MAICGCSRLVLFLCCRLIRCLLVFSMVMVSGVVFILCFMVRVWRLS